MPRNNYPSYPHRLKALRPATEARRGVKPHQTRSDRDAVQEKIREMKQEAKRTDPTK